MHNPVSENKKMTFLSLRSKEVINIADGRRLGYACDLELDIECGKICALILPSQGRLFSKGHPHEKRIPWSAVSRIGDDFILVCLHDPPKDGMSST